MSRVQRIVGSHVSGLRSRSHHPHWDDCSPIRGTTKIDRIKQSVDTWNHIHKQEQLRKKLCHARVLYALPV